MAELYKSWLPEESLTMFKQKGSYVVRPWTGFKVLSLNTNYCYSFDFFTYVRGEAEDVDQVLEWIVGELAESEQRGEKVWIGKNTLNSSPYVRNVTKIVVSQSVTFHLDCSIVLRTGVIYSIKLSSVFLQQH
jgi:hypothetical protein